MFGIMVEHMKNSEDDPEAIPQGMMPSDFMRKLRPEYYSDTQARNTIMMCP